MTLVKSHGRIIGLSPIYDYIFRPSELQDLNLYDWVRLCKHKKITKSDSKDIFTDDVVQPDEQCELTDSEEASDLSMSDIDSDDENTKVSPTPDKNQPGIFCFIKGHPLYKSHAAHKVSEDKAEIPNFIGETLPRRDKGDREWYCCTMLALFKPWRTGLDLKTFNQSWDDSFNQHQFTTRQWDVMDNFHLRYECLDA